MGETTSSGSGCPCHHLNGGPCLFDVVSDPSESHNLAADPAHKRRLVALMDRFRAVSATWMPMAGLSDNSALENWDTMLQCNVTQATGHFRPYAPDVPWPHPADPAGEDDWH